MDVRRWSHHLPALPVGILIGMGSLWWFQHLTAPSFAPTATLSCVVKIDLMDVVARLSKVAMRVSVTSHATLESNATPGILPEYL